MLAATFPVTRTLELHITAGQGLTPPYILGCYYSLHLINYHRIASKADTPKEYHPRELIMEQTQNK